MYISKINTFKYNCIVFKKDSRQSSRVNYFSDKSLNGDVFQKSCLNQATFDTFTGLKDKKTLLYDLQQMTSQLLADNKNLKFAMFDMDNFKSINEILGYETGDDFIKAVANQIQSSCKDYNLDAYRFGGEEFIILFPSDNDLSDNTIFELCNSIKSNLQANPILNSKKDDYINKINSSINEFKQSTDKINQVREFIYYKRIISDLYTQDTALGENETIKNYTKIKQEQTNGIIFELISKSLKEETEESQINMLKQALKKEDSSVDMTQDDKLIEYLSAKYDKSDNIYKYTKWKEAFEKNNGFSITGDVLFLAPEQYKNAQPMQLITNAGENVNLGKSIRKGQIYVNCQI